jgi:hypothetical protein
MPGYLLLEKQSERTLLMREEDLSRLEQGLSGIQGKDIQTQNCYQKGHHSVLHVRTVDELLFHISRNSHMFPRWQFVGFQEHLPAWPTPVFLLYAE